MVNRGPIAPEQVSKGFFRSEQAWNLAHQDNSKANSDAFYSKQVASFPSFSHHMASLPNPSCTFPSFSHGLPSVSQPPSFIPYESFSSLPTSIHSHPSMLPSFQSVLPSCSQPRFHSSDQHEHSSASCESDFRPQVSLEDPSVYTQNRSKSNASLSQPTDGDTSDDENCEDNEDVLSSEHQIEIVGKNGDIKIKRNMKLKDVFKLQDDEKVVVNVNECGQPVGDARRVLTRWMTELVKQPNLCPPDVKNFRELRNLCGCHLLKLVRGKFSFPNHDNVDNVLMHMFDAKFRNNKHKIVKKLYKDAEASLKKKLEQDCIDAGYSKKQIEEIVKRTEFGSEDLEKEFDNLPYQRGFASHQWLKLVNNIKSLDFKRRSEHGKAARRKHSHSHTTGTTSFAQKKVEYMKMKKRKPGYIEFFDFTHKKKSGAYARDKSALFMEFAKQKMEYRASGNFLDEYAIQREAWDFCMGEDAPSRARGFGVGVTKSQVRGFRAEHMEMRNEGLAFDHSRSMEDQIRKEFAAYKAGTDAAIKSLQAEVQLYRTAFVNGIDPMSQA